MLIGRHPGAQGIDRKVDAKSILGRLGATVFLTGDRPAEDLQAASDNAVIAGRGDNLGVLGGNGT